MEEALALYLAVYRTVDHKVQELLGVCVIDVHKLYDQQSRTIVCTLKQPDTGNGHNTTIACTVNIYCSFTE